MPHVPGLRSPYEKIGGLVHFGRMVDKIRLRAAGKLPAAYAPMCGDTGDPTAFDGRCCRFLGIRHAALAAEVERGTGEAALFAWACRTGRTPEPHEAEVWNAFMTKRGWRDAASASLREEAKASGLDPAAILTFFDLIEAEEERPLFFAPEPPPLPGPFPGFAPTLIPGLRGPYEAVGGLVHFGRFLDKVRLHAEGKLPPDWVAAHGTPTGYDALLCRFLRVSFPDLAAEARKGGAEEEVLERAFALGRRPNEEEILVWNAYLAKRSWRDEQTPRLHFRLQKEGLPSTAARTMFDFIDLDEGRPPRFP